ncbi:MFS transporter [Alkalihalobacillus sp. R86527]|uniref:MFS transporter n=1 Tax=Alkalihalobacillus sp. R86527 TaxID=3093863 RepID=UPI0036730C47
MGKQKRFLLITFLLGVFLGALDSGVISPALTTLVKELDIELKFTVWVVTIYTLVYAVSMPITGKLADLYGRKRIFLVGIFLLALGSLVAGLSGSLPSLLTGRAIQAAGAGGIIPIANAVIGSSFPKEKRGMALGLIGAMFGIASILGPAVGGFLVAQVSWRWIFILNIPIAFIIFFMALKLPVEEGNTTRTKLDWKGALLLSVAIISLLLGLTNLNTKDLIHSITTLSVWPLLLFSVVILFPFMKIEASSEDPIINTSYFRNRSIVLALLISTITGVGIISMIFIPSFSELLLELSTGRGGYVMVILALASGFAAPIGGILLDKWGAKQVVLTGFSLSLIGALIFSFLADGWVMLIIGMTFSGVGIGFTMGTPLNYIMFELTPEKEAGASQSLVSLFRSIGTSLGPVILAGFIATSTLNEQTITNLERSSILIGYERMYLASSVIFLIGIILALFLRLPYKK